MEKLQVKFTDEDRARGAKVLMHSDTVRDELFRFLDGLEAPEGTRATLVDTWETTNHPDGNGGTFTLYCVTVVYICRDAE